MARMARGEGCSEPSGEGLAEEDAQSQQDSTAQCFRLCKTPAPQLCRGRLYYLHHRVMIIALIFGHKFMYNATDFFFSQLQPELSLQRHLSSTLNPA